MVSLDGDDFPEKDKNQLARYLLVVFIMVIFLIECIYIYSFRIDDTYISLRYAKNLAVFGELSFNLGEQPTEGYSNFLLILIETLFIKLGVQNVIHIPKLIGISSGLFSIWITFKIADKIIDESFKFIKFIPSLALALSSPMIVWSVGGLETVLFVFLTLGGIYYFIVSMEEDDSKFVLLADLFFFLSLLCRIEGLLFWVLSYLYAFVNYKNSRFNLRIKCLSLSVIFVCMYFGWKYIYFGQLLPMPFYAKYNTASLILLIGGLRRFKELLNINLNFVFLILSVLMGPVFFRRRFTPVNYLLIILIVYTAYPVSLGYSVVMDQVFRLYVPMLPMLYLVGASGFQQLLKLRALSRFELDHGLLVLAFSMMILATGWYNLNYLWNRDFGLNNFSMSSYTELFKENSEQIGKWIADRVPPGSTIVIGDIGAVGFYSNLRIIDTWSLVDKDLVFLKRAQAEYKRGTKEYLALEKKMNSYILDQKPEFIVLEYIDLSVDARFNNNYLLVSSPYIYENRVRSLYVRKDLFMGFL